MRPSHRVDPKQPLLPLDCASFPRPSQEAFRQRFQDAFAVFLRKGFGSEQCFRFVWDKTLEEIALPKSDQKKIRREMMKWARQWNAC